MLPVSVGIYMITLLYDWVHLQNVTHRLSSVCASPRANFIGNVDVGRDVSLSELRRLYNAVRCAGVHATD